MKQPFVILFILRFLTCTPSFAQDTLRNRCKDITKEDIHKTIRQYKNVRAHHPNDQGIIYGLGMSYYSLHEFKIAILYFDTVIALNPHYNAAFLNRGICKYALKDKNGACEDLKKCLEMDQDYDDIMDGKKLSVYVKESCK